MSIGFTEIFVILLVVIILFFGPKKIPEFIRMIARAGHEYKKTKEALKKESDEIINAESNKTDTENKSQSTDIKTEDKTDN
ncbi:MAG: twin-arginine translocase TatA/TatE family subunit [Elusimicrobia bacterium]|nr:twin-arginine translocase TatA/TatE family subunit [Elusimicrobiota bacterium]